MVADGFVQKRTHAAIGDQDALLEPLVEIFYSHGESLAPRFVNPLRAARRLLAHGKIGAVGMMEHKRADAGLGIHHHSFRQIHADFLRPQQHPEARLVFEIRACGIAKTVALAAIARGEAVGHGHRWRIRETPIFADAAMQPFGAGLGGFERQCLQTVRKKIVPRGLRVFGLLADARAGA